MNNKQKDEIIANIGFYGTLIMSTTTESLYTRLIWTGMSVFWFVDYLVLRFKK